MKYFLRAIKAFLNFTLFLVIILAVLILVGIVPADPDELFRNGTDALWQIALILGVIAAFYPKVEYARRTAQTTYSIENQKDEIIGLMKSQGYRQEEMKAKTTGQDDRSISFRKEKLSARINRKMEDRITVTSVPEGLELEGLRKDVMRIASAMEYHFNPHE